MCVCVQAYAHVYTVCLQCQPFPYYTLSSQTSYRERKKIMLNVEHRLMLQVRECGVGGARDGRGVDW